MSLQEDFSNDKIYDLKIFKRLSKYLLPHIKIFIIALITLFLGSFLLLAGPYLTKIAIDDYILKGDYEGLRGIGLIYISILAANFFVNASRVYLMNLAGQRVIFDLRLSLFSHLLYLPHSFFDKNSVGKLVSRVVDDVESLSEMFTTGVIVVVGDVVSIVGIAVVMYYMNSYLAMIFFLVLPCIFLTVKIYRRFARGSFRKLRTHLADLNSFIQESISGILTVRLFQLEEKSKKKFNFLNSDNMSESIKNITYNSIFFPFVELIKSVSFALIIWYGGGMVIQKNIDMGVLIAFIQYINRFFIPIRDLAEKFDIFQGAFASSERIFAFLDISFDDVNESDKLSLEKKEVFGKIEFKNVWFAYEKDNYVLKDVSFDLMPGESLAIIGATGSGKTSVINLICKFYDYSKGKIFFDDKDIKNIKQSSLRHNIGIIQQDVFLFAGSFNRNIGLSNSNISNDRIMEASKLVFADDFISEFIKGYDHEISEGGKELSMGQKQLIAFARALAFDPVVLVLDEATSNIDTHTEEQIHNALGKLLKGRTSIIIAHRLSTIKDVDKVLILEDGNVVEFGYKDALIAKQGMFYDLMKNYEGLKNV